MAFADIATNSRSIQQKSLINSIHSSPRVLAQHRAADAMTRSASGKGVAQRVIDEFDNEQMAPQNIEFAHAFAAKHHASNEQQAKAKTVARVAARNLSGTVNTTAKTQDWLDAVVASEDVIDTSQAWQDNIDVQIDGWETTYDPLTTTYTTVALNDENRKVGGTMSQGGKLRIDHVSA